MFTMTTLDWICLALLVLSVAWGLWRGFIWEVMSLAGWFVGGAAALYLADYLSPHLAMTGLSDTLRFGLAFVLIFICTLIAWSMLSSALKNAVGAVGLGALDRLLGGLFGLARGGLILTLLVVLLSYTPIEAAEFWQTSLAVKLCNSTAQAIKPYLPASGAALIKTTP